MLRRVEPYVAYGYVFILSCCSIGYILPVKAHN
uniref:Uncharacterized protein n=1 Tax=Arundo donax TaxID=35708 RepID=A0A0A9EF62_ARUDO